MNDTAEYREQELNKLISFTKSTDDDLEKILSTFGWTPENLCDKNENYVLCPFNPGHRLPEKNLQQHIDICQRKEEGYNEFDVELSEPTLSPDNPYTIKIDTDLLAKILLTAKEKDPKMMLGVGDRLIPRTSNRIFADFTSDERAAIYDYVIANTQKIDIGQDIADLNKAKGKDEQKSISYLELLAQERNLKRRRAKHRGVHTNKKSHVEVMREVIEQQMEMFKEYLCEQGVIQDVMEETVQEVTEAPNSSITTDANSRGTKYLSDRDANYYQEEKTVDRYSREEVRREHRSYHYSERNDSQHNSYRRDKYGSSEERHKSRESLKRRDKSKDRSKHKDRKRNKSKDRYRNRSNERRESRHDKRRNRKRSRSKTRR